MEGPPLIVDQPGGVRIEPLASRHDTRHFDCGRDSLNVFLQRHALTAPSQGLSQTWVTVSPAEKVLAFHTLAFAAVAKADATARVIKGMPNYDIPCVLLARLAVDRSMQGQGLGAFVLETALRKAVDLGRAPTMADHSPGLPIRAMLVHAIDATAADYYRHHGFEPSPTDSLHLFMLLKDIEASLRAR
jgi:GNAT superfamily N-acetyltransferase